MLKFSEMWPAGVPFSQLLYPCDIAPIVLAVPSFLAQQDVLGPSYYFFSPSLESTISLRSSCLFSEDWLFQNQELDVSCTQSLLLECHYF